MTVYPPILPTSSLRFLSSFAELIGSSNILSLFSWVFYLFGFLPRCRSEHSLYPPVSLHPLHMSITRTIFDFYSMNMSSHIRSSLIIGSCEVRQQVHRQKFISRFLNFYFTRLVISKCEVFCSGCPAPDFCMLPRRLFVFLRIKDSRLTEDSQKADPY